MFSFLSRNDTVQYLIAFSLLLLTDVQEVDAACTSSSEPCELHSGNCFNPVLLSLNGDVSAAIDALEYGKYCGRFNRCRPKKIASDLCQFDEVSTCKRKKSTKFNSKKEKNKKGKKEKYSKDEDEEEEAPPSLSSRHEVSRWNTGEYTQDNNSISCHTTTSRTSHHRNKNWEHYVTHTTTSSRTTSNSSRSSSCCQSSSSSRLSSTSTSSYQNHTSNSCCAGGRDRPPTRPTRT
mmetsp:Transcript_62480/g.69925  ORF Transcript_62480/g.69925 Transcript_62480/m.69925 type:complete len:234 (-) Transcript_62480:466-1167(-)